MLFLITSQKKKAFQSFRKLIPEIISLQYVHKTIQLRDTSNQRMTEK